MSAAGGRLHAPVPRHDVRPPMALRRYRLWHLIATGWKPMRPLLDINWCGHSQQVIPWSEADGYWRLASRWSPRRTSRQPGSRHHAVRSGYRGGHRTTDEGDGNTPSPGVTRLTVFLTMRVSGG